MLCSNTTTISPMKNQRFPGCHIVKTLVNSNIPFSQHSSQPATSLQCSCPTFEVGVMFNLLPPSNLKKNTAGVCTCTPIRIMLCDSCNCCYWASISMEDGGFHMTVS